MFRITKEFHFSASHQLCQLAEDHPCGRLHGHNYIIEVELSSETLDQYGFVLDYNELKPLKQWIDDTLDHRHLNDVFNYDMVTSEYIAKKVYDWCIAQWPQVSAVRVSETPKTWAEYRP